MHVLLRREGWEINMKKTRRIYNELGLQMRNKPPKRRVKAKLREDRQTPVGPNDVWAMDFVHDQLATGKKLRTGKNCIKAESLQFQSNFVFSEKDYNRLSYFRVDGNVRYFWKFLGYYTLQDAVITTLALRNCHKRLYNLATVK